MHVGSTWLHVLYRSVNHVLLTSTMVLWAQPYVVGNFQFRLFPGYHENGCPSSSDAMFVPYPSRGRKPTFVYMLDTEVSLIPSSRCNKVDPQPLRDASWTWGGGKIADPAVPKCGACNKVRHPFCQKQAHRDTQESWRGFLDG